MSGGFFDQRGNWIPQGPRRHVLPLALEAAEALAACMADGTQDKALVAQLIETRCEGRKMPGPACLPPLAQVATRILDGDGTDDAAQWWLAQRASCTT